MGASDDVNGGAVPLCVVAVNPAEGDRAILIPPDGLRSEVPAGTSTEAGPFASEDSGAFAFERNFSALRAGDSVHTFIGVAEPSACPEAFSPADADSD